MFAETPFCVGFRPVAKLAVSDIGDCLAVATQGGMYAVDLLDSSYSVAKMAGSHPSRVTDLVWNSTTREVYITGDKGAIMVFRQI